MARTPKVPPHIRYNWPRWEVVQGTSRYTCFAPDQATAEENARRVGFPQASAVQIA